MKTGKRYKKIILREGTGGALEKKKVINWFKKEIIE
jgi:hypothetical protein